MMLLSLFTVLGIAAQTLGEATDAQLLAIGEILWLADTNRIPVDVNLQGQLVSGSTQDLAPNPLFPNTPPQVNTIATYVALQVLQDNYIADTDIYEVDTEEEDAEIDNFIEAIFNTTVMQKAYEFLNSTGEFSGSYAEFQVTCKEVWFTTYMRDNAMSSSGFEHVFVGEMNGNKPAGLHNWVRHLNLEKSGELNYLGYIEYMYIGGILASEITLAFEVDDMAKPVSGFFVKTSPEFDFAVFTICFIVKPNVMCKINMAGNTIPVQTFDVDCPSPSGKCVGTSYPTI